MGPPQPARVDTLPSLPGLAISSPVSETPGATRMLVASKSLEQSAVYVSLAPGSAPSGLEARILDRATAQSITVSIVRGGFDPVAIPASIGDTLAVEISGIAGETTHALSVIAPRRPPTIVRTDPPPRKRDVALNPIIVIVFSEPIDASTLGPE